MGARKILALSLLASAIAWPSRPAVAALWPDTVDRVRADMASPDAARRRAAADALGAMTGDGPKSMLETAVNDVDVDVRLAAATSAARANIDVSEKILPWLTDADARLREAACVYFSRRPANKVVKVVSRALGDTEVKVRMAAVRALGASAAPEAVAPLLARLDDVSSKVRQEVARALGRLADKRAVTPLVSKIQDEASEVRQSVVRALGELGDPRAAPALGIALRDSATEVRIDALAALGRLKAAEAVPSIAPLLTETKKPGSAETRRAALAALGRIGTPAAVDAILRSFGLDDDAAAREAAVVAGPPAGAALLAMLRDGVPTPSRTILKTNGLPATVPDVAASAAYVIAAQRTVGGPDAIIRAMRRGDIALAPALHALGAFADASALAVCLEHVTSNDAETRREALWATSRMLDPEHPDGRAVEPLLAALRRAQDDIFGSPLASSPRDNALALAAEIATLLGRTGAARVSPVLVGLTASKEESLRIAAIDALGTLADGAAGPTLAKLLDDRSAAVRIRAGIALGRAGGADVLGTVLDRAGGKLTADRLAVALALVGMLARVGDDAAIVRMRAALDEAGPERDLLLGALGRAKAKSATDALIAQLDKPALDVDARRAIAGALGSRTGDARALASLRKLTGDLEGSVRAQAAWSLGAVSDDAQDLTRLATLTKDASMPAAANAAGALGRLAARLPAAPAPPPALCEALGDGRAYVRANAIAGLSQLAFAGRASMCGDFARALALVERDGDETVRAFAARWLGKIASSTPERAVMARAALDRCVLSDPSGAVAQRCRSALVGDAGTPASGASVVPSALVVFVSPDDGGAPVPRSPYAIERPDGLLHLGTTDRRASVLETGLGAGEVRLRVPIPMPLPPRD